MDEQAIIHSDEEVNKTVEKIKITMSQMKKKKGKVWNNYQRQLDFYTLTEKEFDDKYGH